jgi:hypothetical protein
MTGRPNERKRMTDQWLPHSVEERLRCASEAGTEKRCEGGVRKSWDVTSTISARRMRPLRGGFHIFDWQAITAGALVC